MITAEEVRTRHLEQLRRAAVAREAARVVGVAPSALPSTGGASLPLALRLLTDSRSRR